MYAHLKKIRIADKTKLKIKRSLRERIRLKIKKITIVWYKKFTENAAL